LIAHQAKIRPIWSPWLPAKLAATKAVLHNKFKVSLQASV
jgi:hypothetical protein